MVSLSLAMVHCLVIMVVLSRLLLYLVGKSMVVFLLARQHL